MRWTVASLSIILFTFFAVAPSAAPVHGDVTLRDAGALLAGGDTLAAITVLERSGLESHTDPAAAVLLGRLLRDRGTIIDRLRSQRVLEAARLAHPGSAAVEMELGRTYLAQRFIAAAMDCFQRVLDMDPSQCDARRLLADCHFQKWRRVHDYTHEASIARRQFRAALQCDDRNADAAFKLLVAGYALGESSIEETERWMARFPSRPEFAFFRGVLAFEQRDFATCASHFAQGLALLPEEHRAEYEDLSRVLEGDDGARYLEAAAVHRAVLARGYWLARDPDATTVVNESALEHVYRVFLADMLFSNEWTGLRGCRTDRGEVFVKFGAPMSLDRNLGDDAGTGPVELWSYSIAGVYHQVVFVDEFLNGNPRIPRLADLELNFIRNTGSQTSLPSRVPEIGAAVDVTVFRDDELSASAYVAMRVDVGELEAGSGGTLPRHLVARDALFDETWNRLGDDRAGEIVPADDARWDAGGVGVVRRLALGFGLFHAAITIEDAQERVRSCARVDADATRFATDALAMSDVLLFEPAPPPGQRTHSGVIERGGRRMLPRVGHRYGSGQAIHLYVEIYQLAAPGGTARYDVRIAIHPAEEREAPAWSAWTGQAAAFLGIASGEPVIAQQYRREGPGHGARESIAIAVDALRPGTYDLVVEVTDAANGARAASITPVVRVVEESGR